MKSFKSKDGGQGRLLSVDMVDAYGTEIQATMFNDAADKFENLL